MIKRTITISSPSHLSLDRGQLVVYNKNTDQARTLPIEDIGYLLLENDRITLTLPLIRYCLEQNVGVIVCDDRHLPLGSLLSLSGHELTGKRVRLQAEPSKPLVKQLWRRVVISKINNQADLVRCRDAFCTRTLKEIAREVLSGDSTNREGVAARQYWSGLLGPDFIRDREGAFPNELLNYGYAILRAITARAIVGSGLSPEIGLFHHNQYNALPLADDLMEPYRPFVDEIVLSLMVSGSSTLDKEARGRLIQVSCTEVSIGGLVRPVQLAMSMTTASLAKCYEQGKADDLLLPSFVT